MNTTNPLGGIPPLDRYEADGRPPAAELPPARGAGAALRAGRSRPRFALAPEPRLSLERTDTGMTRSDSMTETSELLTSLATRACRRRRAGRRRRRDHYLLAARSETARLGRRLFAGGAQAAHRAVPREAQAPVLCGINQ